MKISKQDRLLPHLGLLNFEGDAVRAYKKPDGDNFIIVDDKLEIIAEWDSLEIFEFTRGDFALTTSYGKDYRYTDWNDDCKPRKEDLDLFIGIVDYPEVVKRLTGILSTLTEDDIKRNSIESIQLISERTMPPMLVVKYTDERTDKYSDIGTMVKFMENLKNV
jgi:hypothetical protein